MIRLVAALTTAATLKAGGNAFMGWLQARRPLMVAAVATRSRYRLLVDPSGLQFDFGRLMGCCIVAFFLVSQLLAVFTSHHPLSSRTLIGRTFILLGGLMILI